MKKLITPCMLNKFFWVRKITSFLYYSNSQMIYILINSKRINFKHYSPIILYNLNLSKFHNLDIDMTDPAPPIKKHK
jgi:hypothetical protein